MKILSIETSCDETGIAVLERLGDREVAVLGNALASQIEIHSQYGGVFPALAKRAHAEKITLLIEEALSDAELLEAIDAPATDTVEKLAFLDEKESALKEHLTPFLTYYAKPDIDYIAVTIGPGLEPALWVGINTARALATIWGIPIIPINHMEGHVVTAAFTTTDKTNFSLSHIQYPLLSLLVSGGHTELVVSEQPGHYKKVGATRDDAVGEAFDKVARMLGLPYPGGPAVSKLAAAFRAKSSPNTFELPRPMLHSGDYDFSFSGIKTAVLYAIRDLGHELTDEEKEMMAAAFEDAAIGVLVKKTLAAADACQASSIIVGGGVASNTYLRQELTSIINTHGTINLLFPEPWLATDNAIMIGLAAMLQIFSDQIKISAPEILKADGNLSL